MGEKLSHRLDALAIDTSLPDGSSCRTVEAEDVMRLANEAGITGRMVELAALGQQILPNRYLRNMKTLSIRRSGQTDRIGRLYCGAWGAGRLSDGYTGPHGNRAVPSGRWRQF
jgi:hypothetical protein